MLTLHPFLGVPASLAGREGASARPVPAAVAAETRCRRGRRGPRPGPASAQGWRAAEAFGGGDGDAEICTLEISVRR